MRASVRNRDIRGRPLRSSGSWRRIPKLSPLSVPTVGVRRGPTSVRPLRRRRHPTSNQMEISGTELRLRAAERVPVRARPPPSPRRRRRKWKFRSTPRLNFRPGSWSTVRRRLCLRLLRPCRRRPGSSPWNRRGRAPRPVRRVRRRRRMPQEAAPRGRGRRGACRHPQQPIRGGRSPRKPPVTTRNRRAGPGTGRPRLRRPRSRPG
mmetsp:Transcript_2018/g.4403  ORF Transcript_2018/g.4403 Transcript_2018/m.4403 type:complete len:206 (-) Transcript_2018:182-799(-)